MSLRIFGVGFLSLAVLAGCQRENNRAPVVDNNAKVTPAQVEEKKSAPTVAEDELPSVEIEKVQKFIKANKIDALSFLSSSLGPGKVTMVGEHHEYEANLLAKSIAESLPILKQLKKLKYVFVEIDRKHQTQIDKIDYSLPDSEIKNHLRKIVKGGKTEDGVFDIVISAKKNCLNLFCLDYYPPLSDGKTLDDIEKISEKDPWIAMGMQSAWKNDINIQNERDQKMFDSVIEKLGKEGNGLIYIGEKHVNKKELSNKFSDRDKDVSYKSLGSRLATYYGNSNVTSSRFVGSERGFNGIPSRIDPVSKFVEETREPIFLPDVPPVQGYPYIYFGGTDYVAVVNAPELSRKK